MKRHKSSCYCINLRRVTNAVSNLYDTHLAPLDITVNQFSLLRNLGRLGTCSVSELAAYVGLERTTLVRTLKPLIVRGLIWDASEAGQRNRMLQLTKEGKEMVESGGPLWENAQREIERRIGKENMKQFFEILENLEKD
ncbi:MAG: MarR family winged helix-turn-helix transcriptional regulator [Eubacteriales bacterium]|nr:MarR family winged helix-turn-helix transcriptional regulator [Eubacteriales bacterium]